MKTEKLIFIGGTMLLAIAALFFFVFSRLYRESQLIRESTVSPVDLSDDVMALNVGTLHATSLHLAPSRDEQITHVYPNPYSQIEEFMAGFYWADKNIEPSPDFMIRAAVVPHHLMATGSMASGIKMLEGQKFEKIVLLSPDHFFKCPTLVCTVNAGYKTFFGDVLADPVAIQTLRSSPLVSEDEALFKNEHGIYAVLPYIAHYFPGVPVTPVALSVTRPWKVDQESLLQLFGELLTPDTLLIVSSDFSHYLTLPEAEKKDEATAKILFSKDLAGIAALQNPEQSDCPQCLWVLANLADRGGFYNPSTLRHTNSAILGNDLTVKETTSHFAMVWYQNALLGPEDLAIAGDVTVTRGLRKNVLPEQVKNWWSGEGIRLVNLEGPLREKCTPSSNIFIFCNLLSRWSSLKNLATHWGIENNHMWDQGAGSLAETKRLLGQSGEIAVGTDGWSNDKIRILTLTHLLNPVSNTPRNIAPDQRSVLETLRNNPEPDKMTVVLIHDAPEYQALPRDSDTLRYQSFIDAGADALIVAHSHVPGDLFIYKNKPIFRGIGNFIFDQYETIPTTTGKMVRFRKEGERVLFETMVARIP
ncbi:MAG: capsule synthesis protein CapA [Parcubacteria group bacterium Gr01-1014_18]|nr:MAG: capsule synthesis protein CapA [Parcubacteria group bacterium Greene0416_36]TSC80991.1 MAG: capsule synthesis protein CapA [Parcubacteria group bacterium Gr01-1014_18]TSC98878.1 MAG: capsule synthesis protein CapA [Parcubacteria group bacterium Greene1014_20]TSD06536.1 MAG: capsule synthesis protein CapA [Parcubacteria group bacterium Greene0714_2]